MVSAPALRAPLNGMVPAEQQGVALAEKLGATDLAALRALPAEEIADKPPTLGYFPFPAVDGTIVPRQLVETFDRRDRKSVVQGKSVSVRVDLGGRRIIKQKTIT